MTGITFCVHFDFTVLNSSVVISGDCSSFEHSPGLDFASLLLFLVSILSVSGNTSQTDIRKQTN